MADFGHFALREAVKNGRKLISFLEAALGGDTLKWGRTLCIRSAPLRVSRAAKRMAGDAVPAGRGLTESWRSADSPVPVPGFRDDLGEWSTRIETGFPRESQHSLTDTVSLHLVGTSRDGSHPTIEIVDRVPRRTLVAGVPKQRLRPADLDRNPSSDWRKCP